MQVKVIVFKMPFETKHFNKNQKVWVQSTTGDMAARVIGKFRGKGRYVEAWVNWSANAKENPIFNTIDIDKAFAQRQRLQIFT